MGEVVGIARVRKAKGRAGREAQAAANRVAFGRTAAQKEADRRAAEQRERLLDGARRDD